jgi:SAM-dependent methyltransferase
MGKSRDFREVSYDAKEHTSLVGSILAESHLKPYNIFRHINITSKTVVDIGCGDGAMSREAIDRGADYVLGIDGKPEMIDIAYGLNKQYEGMISLKRAFIEDITGDESFDVAIMSYLLNNARSTRQLEMQCRKAASFLKDGGVAVIYNSNPFDMIGGDFTKYGFRKTVTGTCDGDRILFDYRPAIKDDIINYYISPKAHKDALRIAGFKEFHFEPLKLWPGSDKDFWKDYFCREHLPMIAMIARK